MRLGENMARKKNADTTLKPLEQYEHNDKERLNNPPVGLVDSRTDNGGQKKKTYQYDPHERFTSLKAEFEAQLIEEEKLNALITENLKKVKLA